MLSVMNIKHGHLALLDETLYVKARIYRNDVQSISSEKRVSILYRGSEF